MASEITRDGVTYKVGKTFTFDDDGEIHEHEGGEITEADVDSIIESDQADAELAAHLAEIERLEYEAHHLTPEEQRIVNSKKTKNLLEGD